ncbi:MAG TPA: hypothetical protein VM889_01680 [Candidatus Thermoplasmatota archaeon]|nr:hypothetical protein [Candidatus Thermoplasmatota archaeon]
MKSVTIPLGPLAGAEVETLLAHATGLDGVVAALVDLETRALHVVCAHPGSVEVVRAAMRPWAAAHGERGLA